MKDREVRERGGNQISSIYISKTYFSGASSPPQHFLSDSSCSHLCAKHSQWGTSPVVQLRRRLRRLLPMQGVWFGSRAWEIRSRMPQSQKNQNLKQKQYCNTFNKDFKMVPIQKKKRKIFKTLPMKIVSEVIRMVEWNKTQKHTKQAYRLDWWRNFIGDKWGKGWTWQEMALR